MNYIVYFHPDFNLFRIVKNVVKVLSLKMCLHVSSKTDVTIMVTVTNCAEWFDEITNLDS